VTNNDGAAAGFLRMLEEACPRVAREWFKPTMAPARDAEGVREEYRERVYCYELYHQLRLLDRTGLGRDAGAPAYRLSGELDKAGLRSVTDDGRHKPDFIWHIAGNPHGNAAVVEVKHVRGMRGMDKDLATLAKFLSVDDDRAYSLGVVLVFGTENRHNVGARVRAALPDGLDPAAADRIRVLFHGSVGGGLDDLSALAGTGGGSRPVPSGKL